MIVGKLHKVLVGQVEQYSRPNTFSAINKHSTLLPVQVVDRGLIGDEQGDMQFHGGLDKAIHCYPSEHYAHWQNAYPGVGAFNNMGAFGENFVTERVLELNVCIGDQWEIGGCRFEVSQGRQPCWKLNDRFGIKDFSRVMQDSLYPGWYLRVLRQGVVCGGMDIVRCMHPYPSWSLSRLLELIRNGDYDPNTLGTVLDLPLTHSWRSLFDKRLETASVESWERRLNGPPE